MIFNWFQKKDFKIKPHVLLILDGYGTASPSPGNAITLANTPNMNSFYSNYVNTLLTASGEAVGLSANEKGNTEVGHLTIGAGRVVLQDLKRISQEIDNGRFFYNNAFLQASSHVKKHNSKIHLVGLIGSGITHSSMAHLMALVRFCKNEGLNNLFLHLFTDGRDSPPRQALEIVEKLEADLLNLGVGKIASISGRYYGMDRDNRWDRIKMAYDAIVLGKGAYATSAAAAVKNSQEEVLTDEFLIPTVIVSDTNMPIGTVDDNDALIFYNFRTDRPKELTIALCEPNFEKLKSFDFGYDPETRRERGEIKIDKTFERGKVVKNLFIVTMTEYQKGIPVSDVAYPPEPVINPLGVILEKYGKKQIHIAESEKERFIKYYFNGLRENPLDGEEDVIVPSPSVKTYDLKPEMSLPKVVKEFKKALNKDKFDFYVINIANPDMVAHSGNLKATIKAIEYVDYYVGEIVKEVLRANGVVFITADHGNAEELLKYSESNFFITTTGGQVDTDHSNYPIPFVVVGKGFEKGKVNIESGALSDIAPTILQVMGIEIDTNMTGKSLLTNKSSN